MKAGWQFFKFGEVCELRKGRKPLLHSAQTPGFKPYLIAKYLRGSDCAEFASEGDKNSIGVAANEIIVICDGSNSGETFIGFDGILSSTMAKVVHGDAIDTRFLLHYLGSLFEQFSSTKTGSAIPHLDLPALRQQMLPVPPRPEQQRIVTLLDDAFDGIATAKANVEKSLQNARKLVDIGFQAITEKLGRAHWPVRQVEALIAQHKGAMRTGPFGSQLLHSEFVDEGIAVLGIDNAVANEFRWDRRRYITAEKYQQMGRYRVFPGDVLITIMGTCGRCAVVPDDIPLAINTKHLCCITLDREKCLPEYLHIYFLHDPTARDYLIDQAKGSIMAGLNMGIIAGLPVRIPSLEVQAEIVERFSTLSEGTQRLETLYQRKVTALDELKKSLLHCAFSGQLI